MIFIKKIIFFIFLIVYFSYNSILLANQSTHKIEILVNDNIITNYDIAQHFAINTILDNISTILVFFTPSFPLKPPISLLFC